MNWLTELSSSQPIAWAVLALMLVAVTGLALAQIKIKGVGIGVTGVLFAGIIAGHFGLHIDEEILEFVRDFGLILFVFTIGLQLGPGFFASFRKEGLKLNLLAAAIVLLGAGVTIGTAFLLNINPFASLGLFCGATTNTPALGATQQMLKTLGGKFAEHAGMPPLAYAAAYPGAVAGIIGVILFLKFVFRDETEAAQIEQKEPEQLERLNLVVENPNLENLSIGEIPGRDGVVISRIKRFDASEIETATEHTRIHKGDIILAVGTHTTLEKFRGIVGRESEMSLLQTSGKIVSQRIIVTRKEALGKTIAELNLADHFGVTVTRVTRAEIEMTAVRDLQLQFGDTLQIVGNESALDEVAKFFGNRIHALHETNFMPIFIGIALGVIIGAVPIAVPHVPVPVQLGMAGGPLILAILLSRIGRIGPLVWYMPASANVAFRELGIVLFLACVGLKAGGNFFQTVFTDEGLHWLLAGLAITIIPLLLVALVARFFLKLNFTTISGLLAGSMTDPPALAFAHTISASDAPLVAYATVYPLSMLLRIFTAQILVVIFCG
ncbi:MAG TPA: putative transporter [Verrucomicrobiae bacterium]|jgi:putative transport protein|nr:putative transporter [Verrucomicrobiae bacterium]